MEALHPALRIDKGARGFAKGSDGKQNIRAIQIGFERAQTHHHFRFGQGIHGHGARGAVEGRLGIEQHNRFQGTTQHLPRIQAALTGRGVNELRAYRVSGFGQVADRGATQSSNDVGNG